MAIILVVLAYNVFGDWLRDVLDPRLRQTTVKTHVVNHYRGGYVLIVRLLLPRSFGSKTSLMASPKKLNASTTRVMVRPGNTTKGQWGIRTFATAPPIILPQVGVGGGMPTPRKPRDASMTIATPSCAVASTR